MTSQPRVPIAVGGVGGSGTRLIAKILQELGYYIGGDLNESLDTLWFTLLFKRRDIVATPTSVLAELYRAFQQRMIGDQPLSDIQKKLAVAAASHSRIQHNVDWLRERANSFTTEELQSPRHAWGWKEPNSHIIIEELLQIDPAIHFIQVMRNGLDMAFSGNQNQLEFWGPGLLGAEWAMTPRQSLAYWVRVHRRIRELIGREPRVMMLDYDRLCRRPFDELPKLLRFLNVDEGQAHNLVRLVEPPSSIGRFRNCGIGEFDPADVQFVAELGFPVD